MPNPCDHDSEIKPSPCAIEMVVKNLLHTRLRQSACFVLDCL